MVYFKQERDVGLIVSNCLYLVSTGQGLSMLALHDLISDFVFKIESNVFGMI